MSAAIRQFLSSLPPELLVAVVVATAVITGFFTLTSLLVSKEEKVTDSRQKWLEGLREETAKFLALIDTLVNLVEPKLDAKRKAWEGLPAPAAADKRGVFTVALISGSTQRSTMSTFVVSSEVATGEQDGAVPEQSAVSTGEQSAVPTAGQGAAIPERSAVPTAKVEVALSPTELSELRQENAELYNNLNEMKFRVLLRLNREDQQQQNVHAQLIEEIEKITNAFYGDCKQADLDIVVDCKEKIVAGTQEIIRGTWSRVKAGEPLFKTTRLLLFIMVLLWVMAGAYFAAPYFFNFVRSGLFLFILVVLSLLFGWYLIEPYFMKFVRTHFPRVFRRTYSHVFLLILVLLWVGYLAVPYFPGLFPPQSSDTQPPADTSGPPSGTQPPADTSGPPSGTQPPADTSAQ